MRAAIWILPVALIGCARQPRPVPPPDWVVRVTAPPPLGSGKYEPLPPILVTAPDAGVVRWKVKVGDFVTQDQVVAEFLPTLTVNSEPELIPPAAPYVNLPPPTPAPTVTRGRSELLEKLLARRSGLAATQEGEKREATAAVEAARSAVLEAEKELQVVSAQEEGFGGTSSKASAQLALDEAKAQLSAAERRLATLPLRQGAERARLDEAINRERSRSESEPVAPELPPKPLENPSLSPFPSPLRGTINQLGGKINPVRPLPIRAPVPGQVSELSTTSVARGATILKLSRPEGRIMRIQTRDSMKVKDVVEADDGSIGTVVAITGNQVTLRFGKGGVGHVEWVRRRAAVKR